MTTPKEVSTPEEVTETPAEPHIWSMPATAVMHSYNSVSPDMQQMMMSWMGDNAVPYEDIPVDSVIATVDVDGRPWATFEVFVRDRTRRILFSGISPGPEPARCPVRVPILTPMPNVLNVLYQPEETPDARSAADGTTATTDDDR